MDWMDQLIAGSRALRAEAAAVRAEAQEVRWRSEQAKQRALAAKLAWQEMQQRPRRTPFTLWLPPETILDKRPGRCANAPSPARPFRDAGG